MKKLNPIQKYFVEEFYDDYREGLINRRQFIRRLAYITGSMAATVSTMSLLGCSPAELPDPTEPIPPADPTATPDPTATLAPDPTATAVPDPTATPPPADPTATSPPEPTEEAAAAEPTEPAAAQLEPVPDAQSPFSVPEGDPAVISGEVTFTSQGDEIMAYLARPAAEGVYAGVLVCHENRGLNPHIRDVARRFATEGYVALAIDLLSREGGTAAYDRDEVPGLLGDAGIERHVADFVAGFDYLQGLEFVDGERIGMTGYCFGGSVTWNTVTVLPDLKAAVPFYGSAPPLDRVPNIQAAVLGVYAELDERINAGKDALEQALIEAGVTHQMNVYPGVNHAFHNDTGQRYVEEQATQAWLDTLAWFEQYLSESASVEPPVEPSLEEFPVPAGSRPHDVAPAPDGTVWYTAQRLGELGRLDPATGQTRHIALGPGAAPHGVIVGPDGAPWITDGGLNAIVRVDPETETVQTFPLPEGSGYTNLNTATFDPNGVLWFTGQSGVYGRLDPAVGQVEVFEAPRGRGPYGISTTPGGDVYYASLAGSHIARLDRDSGQATVLEPPTPGQGARRVWPDSRGRIWVSEWNSGQVAVYDPAAGEWQEWPLPGANPMPYAVYVDEQDMVWLSDFGGNALVRFDPGQEAFEVFTLPSPGANVRQILGRPGEIWGGESGTDKLVVIRTG